MVTGCKSLVLGRGGTGCRVLPFSTLIFGGCAIGREHAGWLQIYAAAALCDGRASSLYICLVILTAMEQKILPAFANLREGTLHALTPLLCPPTKLGKVGKFQHYVLIPP